MYKNTYKNTIKKLIKTRLFQVVVGVLDLTLMICNIFSHIIYLYVVFI